MTSRTGSRAFSLVEVMVTAAVLSLGIVMCFESFFGLIDKFSYACDYLAIQPVIKEVIWQAEEDLKRFGKFVNVSTAGFFPYGSRNFRWDLGSELIDGSRNFNLYRINLNFSWKEGAEEVSLSRYAYALQPRQQ